MSNEEFHQRRTEMLEKRELLLKSCQHLDRAVLRAMLTVAVQLDRLQQIYSGEIPADP